jgi:hypothetical protein
VRLFPFAVTNAALSSLSNSPLLLAPPSQSGKAPVGSGFNTNVTGKVVTGFSVKDSDVWQNRRHEWRTQRRYQGQVKGVILDWAGTVLDSGVYAPAVVFIGQPTTRSFYRLLAA